MKDKLGKILNIGDTVCFAPNGAYAGVNIGIIEKFTEKRVCIQGKVSGRYMSSVRYYAPANEIIKLIEENK